MREMLLATKGSLQRGEYVQFVHFANEQTALKEVAEFSFINDAGKVELSSQTERVGQPIEPDVWTQSQNATVGATVIR
jgi:hypothetical protein